MIAYKESDRREEESNENVQGPKKQDLNISDLFKLLLDMNVTAKKWGC